MTFSATVNVIIVGWHQCLGHEDVGNPPGKQTRHGGHSCKTKSIMIGY